MLTVRSSRSFYFTHYYKANAKCGISCELERCLDVLCILVFICGLVRQSVICDDYYDDDKGKKEGRT